MVAATKQNQITSRLERVHAEAGSVDKNTVLVVEDSSAIRGLLCAFLGELQGIEILAAADFAEAKRHLEQSTECIFCAVLDLNLPDAPNGEVVDLVSARGVPVVVLTGSVDRKLRETMLEKQVIDYVVKNNITEIEHVAYVVGRLYENQHVSVLVVDDTRMFREYLTELLGRYRYRIHTAENGKQALDVLREHGEISLVITDYHMPEMNGLQLIQAIRRHHRREDLAIIGLSDATKKGLSAMMLKSGANDFLSKPFEVEEFFCRVTQNTNMVSYVRQVRDSATKDFLTRVSNRRHLFELGEKLHEDARKGNAILAAALIDADHFKHINDTWGHQTGDKALKVIADTLVKALGPGNVVARYGGEEFVCLASLDDAANARDYFETVRQALQDIDLRKDGEKVPITASVGVTTEPLDTLDSMLQRADEGVYRAKEAGRNRVVCL